MAFSSFRSTVPPPANTRFGKVADPGMVAACTNPAALGGVSGNLHAYLSSDGRTITGPSAAPPGDLGAPGRVATDWGLHLIDVNLAMGNLVDIVGQQAKAWLAKSPR